MGHIEISSPDALGIQRISIDGVHRASVVPQRMGEAARKRYGQDVEYVAWPAGRGNHYGSYLFPAEALARAVEKSLWYYG